MFLYKTVPSVAEIRRFMLRNKLNYIRYLAQLVSGLFTVFVLC